MSKIIHKKLDNMPQTDNQAFKKYEQVEKKQTYTLSEQDGQEDFDNDFQIKTCDLSQWLYGSDSEKKHFSNELGQAFEEIGFAILINHGQDAKFYQKMESVFSTLPMLSSLNPEYKTILAMELLGLREGFVMAVNNITFFIMWVAFIPIILLPFCKMRDD